MKFTITSKKKWTAIAAIALVSIGGADIASAQIIGLGLPTIVFDPTSAADIVKDIEAIIQLTEYAIEIDNVMTASQIFFSGGIKAAWRGLVGQIQIQTTVNHFGEITGWDGVLNTGIGAPDAWAIATMPINPQITLMGFPDQMAQLASIDAADAAGGNALTAIGMGSADRIQLDQSLAAIENLVMDESDSTNSEVEQLNLSAGVSTLGLHFSQKVDDKMGALLYEVTVGNKIQRDELARTVQFESDVQGYDIINGFGMGQCISCTVVGLAP